MARPPLVLREIFGIPPFGSLPGVARDLMRIATGKRASEETELPPNKVGLSSLRIFKPSIGLPTWMGRRRPDRRVPLYNYFNRVPQPKDEGYSVRVTYARDYRGGRFTYDGHLGTDFAVPVGTEVVAGAPGVVTRVENELDRGGLKVCVDHGRGMLSTSNHLSRSLVRVGQRLGRGERLGLSGASGIEFLLFFPWVAPHLHYNLWLNSEPVDPFARPGEVSLWREGDDPRPALPHERREEEEERPATSPWSEEGVQEAIAACGDPELRARMEAIEWLPARGTEVVVQRNYRPPLFSSFPEVYTRRFPREPRFDLPFRHEDFVGVAHAPGSKLVP